MPSQKELRFFDQTEKYERGLGYYESLFDGRDGEQEIGEASPPYWNKGAIFDREREYTWNPENDAPTRIQQAYPDLKIIVSLRNPVSRMSSQYWKNVRQGREHASSLYEAVQEELEGTRDPVHSEICWVYKNSYSKHLEKWFDLYDRKSMKVLIFEEWTQKPEKHVREIFRFLDVNDGVSLNSPSQRRNRSRSPRSPLLHRLTKKYLGGTRLESYVKRYNLRQGRPKPSDRERHKFFQLFEEDIGKIELMLERSLDVWKP
mgnify:CR=1 FL=1